MLKETVLAFIDDGALSRGAAIGFSTVTSLAPVLLIVVAIAGLAFGRDAAQNAISGQLTGLMGRETAEVSQSAVTSTAGKSSGRRVRWKLDRILLNPPNHTSSIPAAGVNFATSL